VVLATLSFRSRATKVTAASDWAQKASDLQGSSGGAAIALETAVMSKRRKGRRNERKTAARRRFIVELILFVLAIAAALYLGLSGMLPPLEPVPSSAAIIPSSFQAGSSL
jgi:hypothetical protein